MTAAAVRERAHLFLALAEAGNLPHFTCRPEMLPAAVDYVVATIRANYPDLDIPFHSRWRHFSAGGRDRWGALARRLAGMPAAEVARVRFDLAVTSVLMDAGAGAGWRYRAADGGIFARSEGLAIASFDLFQSGAFSDRADTPWRADAAALMRIDPQRLGTALQVTNENPLVGCDGRANLLRRLGAALTRRPEMFGAPGRVGNLFDWLASRANGGAIAARTVFAGVMEGFGDIWPSGCSLDGIRLGDAWRHPAARAEDASDGIVPFHKLSQWLAYSLIEPFEEAGLRVSDIDGLTALPEYRNGGLLIDIGVLVPRDPDFFSRRLTVGDEAIVEWRALTVALIDRLADGIRARLGFDANRLPLAKVLEGGTWAAGRGIARARRPDGGPPFNIESDGTVF